MSNTGDEHVQDEAVNTEGDQHVLEPLTFSESIAVENYRSAMSNALSAADSLADKIVTAAVSVGTAYGAVIALAAPKDSTTPLNVLLPFAGLAGALGLALWAQSIAVSIEQEEGVDAVRTKIVETIKSKRIWARLALVSLVLGLVLATYSLYENYGPSAKEETQPAKVEIFLTPSGSAGVSLACGNTNSSVLRGEVEDVEKLSDAQVPIKVGQRACPKGQGTLMLPQRAIAVAKR